jgi:hypothetical protein
MRVFFRLEKAMARQEIILGTPPTGLGGDTPRVASSKINAMTLELYQGVGTPAAPLPLERGGTGGKTQTAAQAALGLVPVSSTSDMTANRLVVPGWQGYGGPQRLISPLDFNVPPTISMNFIGQATSNGPEAGDFYVELKYLNSLNYEMVATSITSGQTYRQKMTGVLGGWRRVYDSINVLLDPSSGGLMSSTVVNGYTVTKYASGIMNVVGPAPNTASVVVNGSVVHNVTLPSGFISTNYMVATISVAALQNNDHYGIGTQYCTSLTNLMMIIRNGAGAAQAFGIIVSVWGRWK